MNLDARLESALQDALGDDAIGSAPPRLLEAVRYAVFPRGARVRPRLCLAVAAACGGKDNTIADATAAAIELLHCASLVHDDMPAFDGAMIRRGKPSVHARFGESLALLAGDALIIRSFQVLAAGAVQSPGRLGNVISVIGNGVGMPAGIVAGQAWECESKVPRDEYQRAKTGALFAAATMGGAAAAGADPEPWRSLGESIGQAYQVADDLLDANGDPEVMGKPVGRDVALDRPSAVRELGQLESAATLRRLVEQAVASVPPCPGETPLRKLIAQESEQFMRLALSCRAAA